MTYYPSNLKTTREETIGKPYKYLRWFFIAVTIASGFTFGYVNQSLGFWMALIGGVAIQILNGREAYIQAIWQIRRGGDLMERLLLMGDRKFVLEQLTKDAAWRGDTVDPAVTAELEKINNADEAFKSRLSKLIDDFTSSLVVDKPEDPKAN